MSDNYDPLSTQTAAITFRRMDALQDSIAAFGKTASGNPAAILVATDGTIQTRRLNRTTDEILLIATDPQGVARPVLADAQGRLSLRQLSAIPITDHDGVRAYLLGPAGAQVQGRAEADGTLHVLDAQARASLASILAQLDAPTTALRDAITGAPPASRNLFTLGQDLTTVIKTQQPRFVTNFPFDFPDAQANGRLLSILGQLDRPVSELYDVRSAAGSVTAAENPGGFSVTLDLGPTGRPVVQRFYSTGSGATVTLQASTDGATWRTVESQTPAFATSSLSTIPGNGYRYLRLTSPTAGVALTFEITASR